MKKCNNCHIKKPLLDYYKMGNGLFAQCKSCISVYMARKYKENPNKYKTLANQWRDNNRDRVKRIRNKREKELYKTNSDYRIKMILRTLKRKTFMKSGDVTINQINNLIQDSNNICFWCDEEILIGKMHLDHIYPLSKNGGHTISNICISCRDCNSRKHNKNPEVWLNEILEQINFKLKLR